MLEDRCSMVILVREAIHQQKIQEFRDPPSTTRRRDQEERPRGSGCGPKSGTPRAGTHSTPTGQSAQPSAHICVQRNQCSDAGGNRRQRRSERNAQASDSTARRVLRQIESKARQAKRRKTVGMVADARGSCPYGIESRATSNCAVVKRKSSRTSKRYTNCAAAFTGRKHREEHPERTAETRRRLGDERRRRKRRRRQKWSEAWKKITREVITPNSNSNCNWPADACGALRRRVGGHRPLRRRRRRSEDHRGDQFCVKWIARVMHIKIWADSPSRVGARFPQQFWTASVAGVGTANRWRKRIGYVLHSWPSSAWDWHCKHYTGRGVKKFYETGAALG